MVEEQLSDASSEQILILNILGATSHFTKIAVPLCEVNERLFGVILKGRKLIAVHNYPATNNHLWPSSGFQASLFEGELHAPSYVRCTPTLSEEASLVQIDVVQRLLFRYRGCHPNNIVRSKHST